MLEVMLAPQSLGMIAWAILPIVIGALIHNRVSKQPKTRERTLRIWLEWFIGVGIGFAGVSGFLWHLLLPDQLAEEIGFAPSFFQYEVAVANLAVGVLGVTSLFVRKRAFWLATIIANAVWLWGDAVGHIYQYVAKDNVAPGNIGAPFVTDVVMPAVSIILYVLWARALERGPDAAPTVPGANGRGSR
jgi:hypothetical protein